MKTKWTDLLDNDVYYRLEDCKSKKEDIVPLAQAKWATLRQKQGYSKEDALIYILELLDSNSCEIDLSVEEYSDILNEII